MKTRGRCPLVDSFEEVTLKEWSHVGKKQRLNPPPLRAIHPHFYRKEAVEGTTRDEGYKKQLELYFTRQTLQMQFVVLLSSVCADISCSCLGRETKKGDVYSLKYIHGA